MFGEKGAKFGEASPRSAGEDKELKTEALSNVQFLKNLFGNP